MSEDFQEGDIVHVWGCDSCGRAEHNKGDLPDDWEIDVENGKPIITCNNCLPCEEVFSDEGTIEGKMAEIIEYVEERNLQNHFTDATIVSMISVIIQQDIVDNRLRYELSKEVDKVYKKHIQRRAE